MSSSDGILQLEPSADPQMLPNAPDPWFEAKIKANGFSLVERFPWKVLFFSRAAIQIHTKFLEQSI